MRSPYTMPRMPGGWEPSAWFCAQSAHTAWGGFAVSLAAANGVNPWWAVLGVLAFAAIKEGWADLTWLEHDSWLGSLQDFSFYMAGALGARLMLWWFAPGAVLLGLLMLGLTVWDYESQQPQGIP